MAGTNGLLVFIIENTKLAVELDIVDRVVRAASLIPLPGASANVLGLLNLNGIPIPIISLRKKLGFEEREIETTDEIIILRRQQALLGLIVDEVDDVTFIQDIPQIAEAADMKHLTGAFKLQDEIILVHDIEAFLTNKEEFDLAKAFLRSVPQ